MRAALRARYTTASALSLLSKHFSPAVARAPKGNDIVCATARGAWLTDVEGRRYLDFQTGIGVANTGHSHPRCVACMRNASASTRATSRVTPLPPQQRRRGHH